MAEFLLKLDTLKLQSYSFGGGGLDLVSSLDLTGIGGSVNRVVASSKDIVYVAYASGGDTTLGTAEIDSEGQLSNWDSGSPITTAGEPQSIDVYNDENSTKLVVTPNDPNEIVLVDVTAAPTVLDKISLTELGGGAQRLRKAKFSADGTQILAALSRDSVQLITISGNSLTLASTLSALLFPSISQLSETEWAVGARPNFDDLAVISTVGNSLSIKDQRDDLGGGFATGGVAALSPTKILNPGGIYGWDGTSLSLTSSHVWSFNLDTILFSSEKAFAASFDSDNGDEIFLIDSADWSSISDSLAVDVRDIAFAGVPGDNFFWDNRAKTIERPI